MATQASDITDLIRTTINELGEMKMTEAATTIQRHIAARELLKENRVQIDAGPLISWRVLFGHNNSARAVGLGAEDVVNITDNVVEAQVPWRHLTANYASIRQVVSMNRSPRKIVDYLKTQRMQCLISWVEKLEDRFFKVPSSSDTVNFYGLPYYIVKSNTAVTTNDGFNGTVPSGYTTVANINPTTYAPKWSNYATQYTNITKADLISKWRRAAHYTDWLPPIDNKPIKDFNTGNDYNFLTNYTVLGTVRELLEAQNDNLGRDVASMDTGEVLFMRSPITWAKKLDDDTTNPVYGVNWGVFKIYVLSGEWMNETVVDIQPGQHTVSAVHLDSSFNPVCFDRRRNFCLATDTTMPA